MNRITLFLVVNILLTAFCTGILAAQNNNRIQPYAENPWYWQYAGDPVMLLGGSKDDNLFQIPDLEAHLDLMQSVGGNYIRNTMSSRDEGNVQPFQQLENGKYDLDQWNPEYWDRFERMLKLTAERQIFVQIEIWDKWDLAGDSWQKSPWYPDTNVNYTFQNTKLRSQYGDFMLEAHDFFNSVPALHNDTKLLAYQQKFVNKLFSYSLRYDHLLYSIDNELHPSFSEEWSLYWARFIQRLSLENNAPIEITEMFWPPELRAKDHRVVLNNPQLFSFFEASQNTSNTTPWQHWRTLQWVRYALEESPRPINVVKIYSQEYGAGRLWRQIIGGAASSRFHRPNYGIGLNEIAQTHLRSMRMWLQEYDIFSGQPDGDPGYRAGHHLLSNRERGEAYCHYQPGKEYSVYFEDGGEIELEVPEGEWQVRWLDIGESRWLDPEQVQSDGAIPLNTPDDGHWLALVSLMD
ncbi:MAG: hypothetical protein GF372_08175 [Candidatus Marinimicrobia bacterium]|nr:hypothetical protein [Candidatus Neomarinimicrobiota bacterium]